MPEVIIVRDVNLIGDSLYSLKPIAELRMQRSEAEIVIRAGGGLAGEMIRKQFDGLLRVIDADVDEEPAEVFDLSAGAAVQVGVAEMLHTGRMPHISECYARILGVSTDRWNGDFTPLKGWVAVPNQPVMRERYVVISPFSASCSGAAGHRPNKTLAEHTRWTLTIEWLRSCGYRVVVLKAWHEQWDGIPVDFKTGESLNDLQHILAGAKAVISVDNGIGHLASALGAKTFILWPPVSSVPFIAPLWSKTTKLLYMRPERVRADQLRTIVSKELETVIYDR